MNDRCLDAQLLAAFAERKLKRSEMPEVLEHLEQCPKCMSALRAAMDLMEPRKESRSWLAAAAAIVVVVAAAPFVYRSLRTTEIDRLVRLAPNSARVAEARLSGGFAWAPYRGPMRSTDGPTEAQRMKLVGAAGELVERADASASSAGAQHAAGIGLVLVEKPEDAIVRLRVAAERAPNDARAWSDLAAAEYTAALRLGRASLYPIALAHADRALRIDPQNREALFNRALTLERLGLTQVAREAWNRYLTIDPSSPWAKEARQHLQRLPASTGESSFKSQQPQLERAAEGKDRVAVDAIVTRFRQQSRTWGEAEYLGRWGDAELRGDSKEATRQLATARAIGASLVRISGESMLRDAVSAIDHAAPDARATIAEAHVIYRRGRMTYAKREPAKAEPDLRRAAMLFEQAGDPMALVARYFAANTRFDQDDIRTARRELETLLAASTTSALEAQIEWELTLCAIADEDWTAAATLSGNAARTFERLGETSNLAFMQTLLGTALLSLGRPDEGWAARAKSLAIQSAEGRGDRLPQSVGEAARVELRNGRLDAARALIHLEETAHRTSGDTVELSNALVRGALIDLSLGSRDAALQSAREAMTSAQRIGDRALRNRAIADARFAASAVAPPADAPRTHQLLSQAIDQYRATGNSFYLPEAFLLRARASRRLGKTKDALRDLEDGIAEIERHRSVVAGLVLGSGVRDARRALFEEIVPLQLDCGDPAGAFANADRARQRVSISSSVTRSTVAELQQKLAGSDAAVLELMLLPREVIAFCVTADELAVARNSIESDKVAALLTRTDDDAARGLYDLLIRPSARSFARARQLIIVADAELQHLPFAALFDSTTKRYLIETLAVATAPSASALQRGTRSNDPLTAVAVALPTGELQQTVALPESAAELDDVGRAYGSVTKIGAEAASLSAMEAAAANAGILHIAGHTERLPASGDAALLFRGRGSAVEPVTWSRIAAMKLGRPVVVLAACETLRAPPSPQAQSLSLGSGFLAAGATDVIGTLTPVADNEARVLFQSLHRQLARGRSAVAALRQAQIEAIAAHGRGWRAVAVLTSRIRNESASNTR
jgi:CHAT domain-containing protein/tetratricopeptide (TPR) repeat protein